MISAKNPIDLVKPESQLGYPHQMIVQKPRFNLWSPNGILLRNLQNLHKPRRTNTRFGWSNNSTQMRMGMDRFKYVSEIQTSTLKTLENCLILLHYPEIAYSIGFNCSNCSSKKQEDQNNFREHPTHHPTHQLLQKQSFKLRTHYPIWYSWTHQTTQKQSTNI